ncbi:hypothetical protein GCM10009803_02730 [Microbacterium ginsengiterrae]
MWAMMQKFRICEGGVAAGESGVRARGDMSGAVYVAGPVMLDSHEAVIVSRGCPVPLDDIESQGQPDSVPDAGGEFGRTYEPEMFE